MYCKKNDERKKRKKLRGVLRKDEERFGSNVHVYVTYGLFILFFFKLECFASVHAFQFLYL